MKNLLGHISSLRLLQLSISAFLVTLSMLLYSWLYIMCFFLMVKLHTIVSTCTTYNYLYLSFELLGILLLAFIPLLLLKLCNSFKSNAFFLIKWNAQIRIWNNLYCMPNWPNCEKNISWGLLVSLFYCYNKSLSAFGLRYCIL